MNANAIVCANSSQHTVNLHSTPFAVRSVQNTRSKHGFVRGIIIGPLVLRYSLDRML